MRTYQIISINHWASKKYAPSLNATWGAFSKNLLTNASPTGAAPTRTVSTDSKCLWVTSLLFARNKTTGGAKCKMVGWRYIRISWKTYVLMKYYDENSSHYALFCKIIPYKWPNFLWRHQVRILASLLLVLHLVMLVEQQRWWMRETLAWCK